MTATLGARPGQLEVTDDASVEAAVKTIEADGGLDVLVNNAGIHGLAHPGHHHGYSAYAYPGHGKLHPPRRRHG